MALDSTKVAVAVTGAVSIAPLGSTAPTDATTALAAAYKDVGYISTDGVVETRDRSTSNIVAWQNSDVVRMVVTEASIQVQFTMIETNPVSLAAFYGSAFDLVTGSVKIKPGATGGRQALNVDYVDGADFVRLFIPISELMSVDDVTFANGGDPIGYTVTYIGYPSTSLGASAQKWFSALKTP
jgi:hypothetical protein